MSEKEIDERDSGEGEKQLISQDVEQGYHIDIDRLPKLPEPLYDVKRRELVNGSTLVILLILFFVGTTHGLALEAFSGIEHKSIPWWVFLILIYSQAFYAIFCLCGLWLTVDPGIIKRSAETCFPLPVEIESKIQSYILEIDKNKNGTTNKNNNFVPPNESYFAANDDSGDTYCTKCLVWRRRKDGNHFHCKTCQRCIKEFDHHCTVFGRCIAGKRCGRGGNYKYFAGLFEVGIFALLTTLTSTIWSLSIAIGPQWAIPIAVIATVYLLFCSRVLILGPKALCRSCRRAAVCIVEYIRNVSQPTA